MGLFATRQLAAALAISLIAASAAAQNASPAAAAPADEKPTVKVGGTLFAQYTYNASPESTDAAGVRIHPSAFDITRAYVNVTGTLGHLLAFRITPDIVRESGSGSSLSGSAVLRLKHAYGQLNLDDWTTKGSWARLGIQSTPWLGFEEDAYRYRVQGPLFTDREGLLSSSDAGASAMWALPGGWGEVHGGFYNGENYAHTETNNQKAFQLRGTLRPFRAAGPLHGLSVTGFVDADRPVSGGKRSRAIANVLFAGARVNGGVEYVTVADRPLPGSPTADSRGWSAWATPKLGRGWELLLRRDHLARSGGATGKHDRDIAGVAYWFPTPKGTSAAVLADYDSLSQRHETPAKPDDTRYGLKLMVSF